MTLGVSAPMPQLKCRGFLERIRIFRGARGFVVGGSSLPIVGEVRPRGAERAIRLVRPAHADERRVSPASDNRPRRSFVPEPCPRSSDHPRRFEPPNQSPERNERGWPAILHGASSPIRPCHPQRRLVPSRWWLLSNVGQNEACRATSRGRFPDRQWMRSFFRRESLGGSE